MRSPKREKSNPIDKQPVTPEERKEGEVAPVAETALETPKVEETKVGEAAQTQEVAQVRLPTGSFLRKMLNC